METIARVIMNPDSDGEITIEVGRYRLKKCETVKVCFGLHQNRVMYLTHTQAKELGTHLLILAEIAEENARLNNNNS